MSIKAGLVGLPNVGKSTLFNALTKSAVPAANYPFCTIDPHSACTAVPDERIDQLQRWYGSQKTIYSTVEFVDIAGLVEGAAAGQGLGNQFLSHIREVDLILHVVRCFSDADITHTRDNINPFSDYEVIVTELALKDLESITKRLEKLPAFIKKATGTEKTDLEQERGILENLAVHINAQDLDAARTLLNHKSLKHLSLLLSKNYLIIANVGEGELADDAYLHNLHVQALFKAFGRDRVIPVSARIEAELAQLPEEEARDMAEMMGVKESGLKRIIKASYEHLGLITFFTCGPKEIHAWPIPQGITIRKAAGEIHSDLEKGFICAEVFNYEDLRAAGSEALVKSTGKLRTEGSDYIVKDGDIVHVRFNV